MKILFLALLISIGVNADPISQLATRSVEAAVVLETQLIASDHNIPQELFNQAKCVGTFPNVRRVGFIFGMERGQGLVSCRVGDTWSRPVFYDITGTSFGLQIGSDSTDLVLIFASQAAADQVVGAHMRLGRDATSVAFGPFGHDSGYSTEYESRSDIYAYYRTRGVYAGATLEGSVLTVDDSENALVYGAEMPATRLLKTQYLASPPIVWPYLKILLSH